MSRPEACIASMTSPEQGAQQECSKTLSIPAGTGIARRVWGVCFSFSMAIM